MELCIWQYLVKLLGFILNICVFLNPKSGLFEGFVSAKHLKVALNIS